MSLLKRHNSPSSREEESEERPVLQASSMVRDSGNAMNKRKMLQGTSSLDRMMSVLGFF